MTQKNVGPDELLCSKSASTSGKSRNDDDSVVEQTAESSSDGIGEVMRIVSKVSGMVQRRGVPAVSADEC